MSEANVALFGKKKTEEKKGIRKARSQAVGLTLSESAHPNVKKQTSKKIVKKEFSGAWRALRQPLVTEKSSNLAANYNQYVFKVNKDVNKNQVCQAIQDLYGVKVIRVNIMKVRRKEKRVGRYIGHTAGYKKAIITLATGEKIESGV